MEWEHQTTPLPMSRSKNRNTAIAFSFRANIPEAGAKWLDYFRTTLFEPGVWLPTSALVTALSHVYTYLECLAALGVSSAERRVRVYYRFGQYSIALGDIHASNPNRESCLHFAYTSRGTSKSFEAQSPNELAEFLVARSKAATDEALLV